VPANQVTTAARASTCAYNNVASKFVTNYQVDKIKEVSPRSCSIIAAILGPTTNAKAINTLLGSFSQSEFVKVMQLKTSKEIWDNIILSYEGDNQVKSTKLQSLRIQYETLKIHNDESITTYFLCIDEIVNCMKNLGEEIKEVTLVENV